MLDFILYSPPYQKDFFQIKAGKQNEIKFSATFFDASYSFTIQGKKEEIRLEDVDFSMILSELEILSDEEFYTKEEYEDEIQKCINEIQLKKNEKIVLSRRKKEFNQIDIFRTLKNLKRQFSSTFVYLFKHKKEVWIGATPELLANWKDSKFETIALAGTKKINEYFFNKEFEEQQHVTDFIHSILKNYDSQVLVSSVSEQNFGLIKHLITNFKANLSKECFFEVIDKLHPTPAVCGLPQRESYEYILKNEFQNRLFYTGKMILEEENSIASFVNLRCLKLYQNGFEIFVGGGITNQSTPENEWKETELKAKVILNSVSYGNL